MAYGKNKLASFTRSLFPDTVPVPPTEDKNLYEDKINAICARYLYYIMQPRDKRLTYDEVLKILEKEFWISTRRIADIIVNNEDIVQTLRKEEKPKSHFKTQWSHLVW